MIELRPLGPFEVGQQPTITATLVDITGGSAVCTGTHWIVTDSDENVLQDVTSPDPAITEVDDNVWTLLMPVLLERPEVLWIECISTGGLVAAHRRRLGVARQED